MDTLRDWTLHVRMSNAARSAFTRWCIDEERKGVDPYDPSLHGPQSCHSAELRTRAKERLLRYWPEVSRALYRLRCFDDPCLVVVLENMPLDPDIIKYKTPSDGFPQKGKRMVSEITTMALAGAMQTYIRVRPGEVFPFNNPFHQVAPQNGHEHEEASYRGSARFPLHNDRIFVEREPIDFLVLYGLRAESTQVATHFLRVVDLLQGIPGRIYEVLFTQVFKDPSTGAVTAALHGDPQKISDVKSSLDLADGWMMPTTIAAREALAWLQARGQEITNSPPLFSTVIGPGTVVISDHNRAVHGRDSFRTSSVGFRRWLQRAHLCHCYHARSGESRE